MTEKTGLLWGIDTKLSTNHQEKVPLSWYIKIGSDGKDWFYLKGGPTGYESFELTTGNVYSISKRGWMACGGSEGGWNQLFVPAEEMCKAFDVLYNYWKR